MAVLRMLYKIRCKLMRPLNGALHGPHVPVWVTRGALVARRYTYAPPRRTSQYRMTFIRLSVSLWNDLADTIFDGGTGGFREQSQCFFIGLSCSIPTVVVCDFYLSLFSVYRLELWGWGLRTDNVHVTLARSCTAELF